jgi:hypothetical protein
MLVIKIWSKRTWFPIGLWLSSKISSTCQINANEMDMDVACKFIVSQ